MRWLEFLGRLLDQRRIWAVCRLSELLPTYSQAKRNWFLDQHWLQTSIFQPFFMKENRTNNYLRHQLAKWTNLRTLYPKHQSTPSAILLKSTLSAGTFPQLFLYQSLSRQCCYDHGCNHEWAPLSLEQWAEDLSPNATYPQNGSY